MHTYRSWIAGLIAIVGASLSASAEEGAKAEESKDAVRQHPKHITRQITKTVEIGYLLYLPTEYEESGDKRWPMILFLHGIGERGSDVNKVKANGLPKRIAQGEDYPFVIVSPQCPDDSWWDADTLLALLDAVGESVLIDPDRVYLTGLSMGGFGTWHLATRAPERFAAIAPICGGGNRHDAAKLKDLPVWAFHGEKDRLVTPDKSQEMVDSVNKAGGKAKLTLYPDAGHDSWTETYENPELYTWFLSNKR